MAAGKYNITLEQGATFSRTVTIRDKLTEVPINLTGAVITSKARVNFADPTPVFTFVCAIVGDPVDGTFTMTLTDEASAALEFEKAFYDLEIAYPGGTVDRVLQGNVVFSKEATK